MKDEPLRPGWTRAVITASVILATGMQMLDATIANVALPHMQASLGATRESVTWVLTSYIVASAVALPISGWLADRIGLRQLFLISIAGFIAVSMLCGISNSLESMILFRALQGAFGAFMVPLSQTVMLQIYPKERHAQAMAMWGTAVMVAPISGPILGGWLTENYTWRWVFYVNLPLGILALAGTWFSLPNWGKHKRRFDMFGFATLAVALLALQAVLDRGDQLDWFESAEIVAETAVCVAAFWMFAVHLATGRTRIFRPSLLADRNFSTALLLAFVMNSVIIAGAALLPPMLQQLFGYPTLTAGLLIAPRGGGMLLASLFVGRMAGKVDVRLMLLGGILAVAWSLYLMTGYSLQMDERLVIVSGFIQGVGMGCAFLPLTILAFVTLGPELRTEASSLFNLTRNVGGSIGISLVTSELTRSVQVSHSELAAHVTSLSLPDLARPFESLGGAGVGMLDAMINRQALMIAYLNDYWLMMLGVLAAVPMILLVRRPSGSKIDPELMAVD